MNSVQARRAGKSDDESSARLQAVLDTVLDAIITIDEQGVILMANAAVRKVFGYAPDELLGRNISTLMPSPHQEQHDQFLAEYVGGGAAKVIGVGREVQGLRRDGSIVPLDLAVSELTIDGRRMFTGVLRDMSDRKRAEAALAEEKLFTDHLLATAHAAVLVLDADGRILRFNHYLERLTGYRVADVFGRDWFETFVAEPDRPRIRALFQSTLSGTPVDSHVDPILTRTGRERLIAWSACRLTDAAGRATRVLSIGNDITALKEAENRVIQSERLAAIGQMVTGLAHESRNALQRARASLEMLQLDLEPASESMQMTRQIESALDELRRLYEEVRGYAAPIHLDNHRCDFEELVRAAWGNLAAVREGKQLTFRLECQSPEGAECHCDRERMLHVLRNVLENAIVVAPDGSEIVVTWGQASLHGRPALRATIRDHGPGLSPEQQARIFEPFYTTKTKGTGLGMAIVRRVVEAHRGEIVARNAPDAGAEIELTLPQSLRGG